MFKKLTMLALASCLAFSQVQAEVTIKSTKPYEKKGEAVNAGPTLSDEHRTKVERITQEYNEKLKAFKPLIKQKNKALKAELAKDSPDVSALEGLNGELYDLKKQEQLVKLQYQVALSRVLTAQQRKELRGAAAITKARNTVQNKPNKSPY